jgi:hypothetical protein
MGWLLERMKPLTSDRRARRHFNLTFRDLTAA